MTDTLSIPIGDGVVLVKHGLISRIEFALRIECGATYLIAPRNHYFREGELFLCFTYLKREAVYEKRYVKLSREEWDISREGKKG